MSATTMVWGGKRAAARTLVQYSDRAADTTTTALVTTDREVRVPVQRGERRVLRGNWVKTAAGLRLRWVSDE
jgi:hypothetical protein